MVNLKTKSAGDGYPRKAIEKTVLRFLGSRTFSHGLPKTVVRRSIEDRVRLIGKLPFVASNLVGGGVIDRRELMADSKFVGATLHEAISHRPPRGSGDTRRLPNAQFRSGRGLVRRSQPGRPPGLGVGIDGIRN